jgi:nucleotide-binding universal stress UspA family protein
MSTKIFKTIATAISFSPNMEAYIAQSLRVRDMLGEKLLLIHVGDKEKESEEQIVKAIQGCGGSTNEVELIWETGDPVDVLLKVAVERKVDLILAGAQPREGLIRYYMGSIARRLVRKSNCSILLHSWPNQKERRFRRIVVNGLDHPKTPQTIKTAIKLAAQVEASQLVIVDEVEPSRVGIKVEDSESLQKASQVQEKIERVENQRINHILSDLIDEPRVRIIPKCIFGKKGYSIAHFAETTSADLLVMNSPDTKLGFRDRVFTHDLEYILSELPSDLLIVHSQKH